MKIIVLTPFLLLLGLLVGCTAETSKYPIEQEAPIDWHSLELIDVLSGDSFVLNEYHGKTILIESFAVWCPTCTKQQQTLQELHRLDDSVVIISLNTDPNEDATIVGEHIKKHGFDWLYAISSPEFTESIIEEFGIAVVNAPSAPVIIVCRNGRSALLGRGHKSVADLQAAITGCGR